MRYAMRSLCALHYAPTRTSINSNRLPPFLGGGGFKITRRRITSPKILGSFILDIVRRPQGLPQVTIVRQSSRSDSFRLPETESTITLSF
jgi:hypothetical protein